MSDVYSILIWWFTIFVIGVSTYPLTQKIFHRFLDRGYIFSKVIGILLLAYTIWLLGVLKILPFYRESIALILLLLGTVNIWIFVKNKDHPLSFTRSHTLVFIILEEILFLVCLAFWSYVRASEPSIRGLEKFMDFGFVESILRSKFFPPLDMWLTRSPEYTGGYFINYYYFGHLVTAVLTKLSGISSIISYNLAIAVLFAFTFTLSFSIGLNILFFLLSSISKEAKKINFRLLLTGALLTAFLVSLSGNLHTIYSFTKGYPNDSPQPFWQIPLGWNPNSYWYPNATRFIPWTIHEFPIYSFVVADLHGHVSDIPFVLLLLALLLNLVIKTSEANTKNTNRKRFVWIQNFLEEFEKRTSIPLPYLALISLLLSVMYMTNAVDGLIYMALSGLVFLYINWKKGNGMKVTLAQTASSALFMLFFFLLGSLPFSLYFKPFGTGIGVLCGPSFLLGKSLGPIIFEADKCQKSSLWMLGILWGFFYFHIIAFLTIVILPKLKFFYGKFTKNAHTLASKISPPLYPTDIFVILTTIISTLLLIFPEFFYIKDIYPMHYRANTMFKLGYQAFMMLGINSAYIFFRIKLLKTGGKKVIYLLLCIPLFFLVGIYPFFAINSYYGGLTTYHGLDGLSWLKREYPQDYEAIVWLRENVQEQQVILEANGESYTDYARVSSYTGLPTIIGWPVHEWLWRGSYDEAGKRIPEVQTLYESQDLAKTQDLLDKYNIYYVFIGQLEKQKYPNLESIKWESLGKKVFENSETTIYKVRDLDF